MNIYEMIHFNTTDTMESQDSKYERAASKVAAIKKFYGKLGGFLLFGLLFLGLNYYTNGLRHPWFLWIVGFWGLGIVIEGFKIFGTDILFGKNWEERKIREEMNKEDNNRSTWL